jgi:putative hydrolase of the HAD superfamily
MPASPQTLLIDLDDTLCENNVYFERAIANFISFLNHREMTVEEVREVLNQVERESIMTHGYGLHSFAHSLVATFERLSVERLTDELHKRIWSFAHEIAEHPMELIDGVADTLEELHRRKHRLIVMTKGNVTEQSSKIERSGLSHFFDATEIVAEKDRPTYISIVDKYGLDPDRSWMIGNSPKSDINPSLAAGLNAVFIPHDQTWVLEHEEISDLPDGRQLLVLERFRQLSEHF